jgi:hypothetical protein
MTITCPGIIITLLDFVKNKVFFLEKKLKMNGSNLILFVKQVFFFSHCLPLLFCVLSLQDWGLIVITLAFAILI